MLNETDGWMDENNLLATSLVLFILFWSENNFVRQDVVTTESVTQLITHNIDLF